MKHIRRNFTLTTNADRILTIAAKKAKIKKSQLLSELIESKLTDPITRLKDQKKELIRKANEIDKRIKDLED